MRLTIALATLALGATLSTAALSLDAAAPPPPPPAPGAAMEKAAPPPPPAAGGATVVPETATGRKAKSEDCYRQADAKNLHGKERKHFHRSCMKEG